MAVEDFAAEDRAVRRYLGAAVLAGIGLAILLTVAPPEHVDSDVVVTQQQATDTSARW